ncbi:hypothetical protein DO659_24625 [Salmonella enterica subsp. enterica serovar Minnesota]|nr:hypothetical protein [Salmonella enterica subsp. enterica serovar Minnesota]
MIKSLPESPEPSDIGIETLCTVGADRKNCCKFVELVNIRRYLSGAAKGVEQQTIKPVIAQFIEFRKSNLYILLYTFNYLLGLLGNGERYRKQKTPSRM